MVIEDSAIFCVAMYFFFFNDTATTEIYTLSLHDALPILRVLGSLLFLFSITVDGVDGELARLTMSETKFGGMLDVITDNIVHVAVFSGIFWGCYRNSGSSSYVYLIPVVLGGFALCG